ncbi:hypothetical protein LBMAG42_05510 [Deltaproteobacteria bacterium]|nr:hypothetical protein LBMAG42_05510 [Deltaproteobacteria bacterium]
MQDSPPGLTASHELRLPKDFDPSTRVILRATGLGWRVRARVAGAEVGTDVGGTRPIVIDLTGKLAPGPNTLTLQIEASRGETSAYTYSVPGRGHVLVRGETWLEFSGPRHIDDLNVVYDKGRLYALARVSGAEGEAVQFRVVRDGRVLAPLGADTVVDGVARVAAAWHGPLWTLGGSAEPFLEYLVATLPDGTSRQLRFGARSAARQERGLALNGEPTYLGVQRHTPGRVDMRGDLATAAAVYAASGLNAFELHGAPFGHTLLDAADELGFPAVLTPRCDGRRRDDGVIEPNAAWAEFIAEGNARMVAEWDDHPSVVLWNLEANEEPGFPELYSAFRGTTAPFVDQRESAGYGDLTYDRIRAGRPLTPFIGELAFHLGATGTDLVERLAPLLKKHRTFGIGLTLPHVLHSRGGDVTPTYAAEYSSALAPELAALKVPRLGTGLRRGIGSVQVQVRRGDAPGAGAVVILRAPGHPPVAAAADADGTALLSLDYAGPATVEIWDSEGEKVAPTPVTMEPGYFVGGRWEARTTSVVLGE